MEEKDKLLKAIEACNKNMSFRELRDDHSLFTVGTTIIEQIFTYSTEVKDIGVLSFRNKYAEQLKNK